MARKIFPKWVMLRDAKVWMGISILLVAIYLVYDVVNDDVAEYALVIDAGSTSSRIHLYKWLPEDDAPIPLIDEVTLKGDCDKTEPGLATQKPGETGDSLEHLIRCARSELDDRVEDVESIPLYLMATAGMRLLNSDNERLHNKIMEQVRIVLKAAPFDFRKASTIDAREEALYAWVAANYLNGSLGKASIKETIGILELGGASGQIAFVPQDPKPEDTELVDIAGSKYRIYARGYDGVGKTKITDEFENERLCFPREFEMVGGGVGKGNHDQCRSEIIEYLEKTDHPAFRRLREETPPKPSGNFLAISNYYHTPRFFGQESVLDYSKLEGAGSKFCEKDWVKIIADNADVPPKYLSGHCLMAAYIPALLEDGFRVEDDDGRVKLRLDGSVADVDWTLGALILLLP